MDYGPSFWEAFISCNEPENIAKQLLKDKESIRHGKPPTTLAVHLPSTSSQEAADIGAFLAPPARDLHPSIARLLYDSVRGQVIQAIDDLQRPTPPPQEDGYKLAAEQDQSAPLFQGGGPEWESDSEPTEADFDTTLNVLKFLSKRNKALLAQIGEVIALVTAHLAPNTQYRDQTEQIEETDDRLLTKTQDHSDNWSSDVKAYHKQRPPSWQRSCYICKFRLRKPHPIYKSMCRPCGNFNLAGLRLSLPESLKLSGRTALVTGARINLGYHTALRLLRCGARVIASTRYPNDAAIRYSKEPDFGEWEDRLKIVGADFRTARDAFALVEATRVALKDWGLATLDILVNNAAQTLTDSIKKEQRAIYLEQKLHADACSTGLLLLSQGTTPYQPRIRGGVAQLTLYGAPEKKAIGFGSEPEKTLTLPEGVKDDGRTNIEPYFKSSWVQNLAEVPYEDVISAHAVNTFVPLILCRELLPLMGSLSSEAPNLNEKPSGYIVNVSSREGIFEETPAHAAKNGKHVHTNMSKAALNMITQTEAPPAWRNSRVAMNNVDPGYMSAAPEMDTLFGGVRPINWEDGAGRVLWPVAIGEVDGRAVWGRFLKHYGAVDVDSALNRG